MHKYLVIKTLELHFECEANNAEEAEALCVDSEDWGAGFTLVACHYHTERADGLDEDEEE